MSAPPSLTGDDEHQRTAPSPLLPTTPENQRSSKRRGSSTPRLCTTRSPTWKVTLCANGTLGSTIHCAQTLSKMLATAYREQAVLETTFRLTKSNLQLAIANEESCSTPSVSVGRRRTEQTTMLEQALGRRRSELLHGRRGPVAQ
ncbi:hypothetical protein EXIGLDRAFT_766908 [Exidia glandulosa HHB12029]|uniref:Uncharacterized protein n=1 Tax=Exidia glandulosa HHB12029 TaxID=1314781 RepID=A0A165JBR4_EXIGL|nr:hypothetical protein EXIGLDRAFT_766908 [Exidia glandulosa HHB12029]